MTDVVSPKSLSWTEALRALLQPEVLTMLFLGFAAGIPILLIFSTLSLWLGEAGIERKAVTFFSWAALGYSFKFVWAPLIDKLPVPLLTATLGKRRAWLLVAQALIIVAIVLMGSIDPALSKDNLTLMALAAVLLGFSSATQDIVIDAYRIEVAETRLQAMLSAVYIAGYRVGTIVAGAGALFLAAWLGTEKGRYVYTAWQWTYYAMAATMLVGVLTTLVMAEPQVNRQQQHRYASWDYVRLVMVFACAVAGFVGVFFIQSDALDALHKVVAKDALLTFLWEAARLLIALAVAAVIAWSLVRLGAVNRAMARATWVDPVVDFFNRYGMRTALLLLALIGLYRISDIVAGVISNVFYQDLNFSKEEIGTAVKTVGVILSVLGGLLGGLLATRYGIMRMLFLGAILAALSNLTFVWLAYAGHDLVVMYTAVTLDNLAAGFASAAFVAFLSSLTNVAFTAVQYAIFSSLMTLLPKTLGGYSGSLVDAIGYPNFFILTAVLGIPVLILIGLVNKYIVQSQESMER